MMKYHTHCFVIGYQKAEETVVTTVYYTYVRRCIIDSTQELAYRYCAKNGMSTLQWYAGLLISIETNRLFLRQRKIDGSGLHYLNEFVSASNGDENLRICHNEIDVLRRWCLNRNEND